MWIDDPKTRDFKADVRNTLLLIGILCLTLALLLGMIA